VTASLDQPRIAATPAEAACLRHQIPTVLRSRSPTAKRRNGKMGVETMEQLFFPTQEDYDSNPSEQKLLKT
jgi:hypothetical protein